MSEELDIAHALTRNGLGARILVALEALGPATIRQLAVATRARPWRIRIAIEGRHPECRVAHSLGHLRLVQPPHDRRDPVIATEAGSAWARRVRLGLHKTGGVTRAYVGGFDGARETAPWPPR